MDFHPAANLFPLLPEAELRELATDIQEHGLREPITLLNGAILDGRNRFLACRLAEVEPHFREWDGNGSPTAWVLSLNLHRRHLTQSQKAAAGALALPLLQAEARERQRVGAEMTNAKKGRRTNPETLPATLPEASGEAREKAARIVGAGATTVQKAKSLQKHAPELFEAVRRGEVAVETAVKEAKRLGLLPSRERSPRRKVEEFKVVRPVKQAPETKEMPPMVREVVSEFERGLALELFTRYPSLLLPEWEEVTVLLRRRLAGLLEGKTLTRRHALTRNGASHEHGS